MIGKFVGGSEDGKSYEVLGAAVHIVPVRLALPGAASAAEFLDIDLDEVYGHKPRPGSRYQRERYRRTSVVGDVVTYTFEGVEEQ